MSDEQRQDFDNLILLCPNHHRLIDRLRPQDYSPDRLRRMKERSIERCGDTAHRWASDAELERSAWLLLGAMSSTGPPRLVAYRAGDLIQAMNVSESDSFLIHAEGRDPTTGKVVFTAERGDGAPVGMPMFTVASDTWPLVVTVRWQDTNGNRYSQDFKFGKAIPATDWATENQ